MQRSHLFKLKAQKIFQDYFKSTESDIIENSKGFLYNVFVAQVALILIYSIGNIIVTYSVSYDEVNALNMRMKLLFEQRGVSPLLYSMNTYPYTILWAVFFILLYQSFSILMKYVVLKSFSEKEVSLRSLAGLEITSYSRFILCLFPILLYAEFFPESYKQELLPLLFYSSIYLITLLTGVYLYAVRYVTLSKTLYSQAIGRSIFTFSTPILAVFFLVIWIIR
ncbi:hypothetical protein [Leptospira stimsonii]|uniref:Yip1 domain-containing protein n=1 Tax=Leptospira stimsonii TaxID=2202203 RepID=A0A396YTQ1_9LEPT|nr:hypothetical protein [Leptospira stimsonii]RHX84744.1 hypothetical protein DLM75_22280 [Leptospira stimsonii]